MKKKKIKKGKKNPNKKNPKPTKKPFPTAAPPCSTKGKINAEQMPVPSANPASITRLPTRSKLSSTHRRGAVPFRTLLYRIVPYHGPPPPPPREGRSRPRPLSGGEGGGFPRHARQLAGNKRRIGKSHLAAAGNFWNGVRIFLIKTRLRTDKEAEPGSRETPFLACLISHIFPVAHKRDTRHQLRERRTHLPASSSSCFEGGGEIG